MVWAVWGTAVALVYLGDPFLGARLAGAVAVAVERWGGRWPENPFINDKAEDLARDLIGASADEAFKAGRQMGLVEAVRLAREDVTPA